MEAKISATLLKDLQSEGIPVRADATILTAHGESKVVGATIRLGGGLVKRLENISVIVVDRDDLPAAELLGKCAEFGVECIPIGGAAGVWGVDAAVAGGVEAARRLGGSLAGIPEEVLEKAKKMGPPAVAATTPATNPTSCKCGKPNCVCATGTQPSSCTSCSCAGGPSSSSDSPLFPRPSPSHDIEDSAFLCRCERVTVGEIKKVAKQTANGRSIDMNTVKQGTRQGMGQCGGYQCTAAAKEYLQNHLGYEIVEDRQTRPLNLEISVRALADAPLPGLSASGASSPSLKASGSSTNAEARLPLSAMVDENDVYDVIVLGAGAVGGPTALFLKEAGFGRVLVLDAGSSGGQGDNKRALGGVRATFGNPGKILVGLDSLEVFRGWEG